MAVNKSSNAVCFKGERKKEDPLSTEIQRLCEGKITPTKLPMFSIDFAAQDLYTALAYQKPSSAHIPFHEVSLPTKMLFPFLKTNTLLLSFKARNMTMRVRRLLKGTLRKKIWSYATQSKKVKETRKPNNFFCCCSCACKKLIQTRKGYEKMRQSQRRRQNQKRR